MLGGGDDCNSLVKLESKVNSSKDLQTVLTYKSVGGGNLDRISTKIPNGRSNRVVACSLIFFPPLWIMDFRMHLLAVCFQQPSSQQEGTHEICHDPNSDLDLQPYFPIGSFSLVGSVHGFVCFNYFSNGADAIYILNPRTREYTMVPEAEGVRGYPDLVNYGFGFDPVKFEYKVVRIYQEEICDKINGSRYYKSECQVYTIGKGYWRSAGHVMFCFGCRAYGVNLYGKIHWLVYDVNRNDLICSLDLGNELFISFPSAPGHSEENHPNLRSLGVFGRCLCVCDNNADDYIEVWVMKEYGVTSSWVKEIVINIIPECNDWVCNEMIYLLKVLDDGVVLFLWREDFLFLHHPVKKTLKMFDVFEGYFLASSHVSSSFSLKTFEAEVVNVF
ncbi:PREDICTED: F-box protein CPR30-like [Nicotiana attenuata]|uniref:F-box protein CPR30-like n=1 Tax=Nicotiana attenuata TaxID=49451 RepID=UPI000905B26A|nr:PREDICTED: F-box protein CPR30-like [Nicotiana attenuata]